MDYPHGQVMALTRAENGRESLLLIHEIHILYLTVDSVLKRQGSDVNSLSIVFSAWHEIRYKYSSRSFIHQLYGKDA